MLIGIRLYNFELKAKTDWSDFIFVKLCYIRHLHKTKTAGILKEMKIPFLIVGGTYGTAG